MALTFLLGALPTPMENPLEAAAFPLGAGIGLPNDPKDGAPWFCCGGGMPIWLPPKAGPDEGSCAPPNPLPGWGCADPNPKLPGAGEADPKPPPMPPKAGAEAAAPAPKAGADEAEPNAGVAACPTGCEAPKVKGVELAGVGVPNTPPEAAVEAPDPPKPPNEGPLDAARVPPNPPEDPKVEPD